MELSKRMLAVAGLVPAGHIAADVGCDHGFVSIYLIEKGICPHVYAADVRPGPLQRAKEHIEEKGLGNRITAVLSDGLKQVPVGNIPNFAGGQKSAGDEQKTSFPKGADVMLAAGMGGKLTIKILSDVPEKTKQLTEVILEPQSEVWLVRRWLWDNGFVIIEEDMVREEGKYYPVMRAVHASLAENAAAVEEAGRRLGALKKRMEAEGLTDGEIKTAFDRFGPMLICSKSAVLLFFLKHTIGKDQELLRQMPDPETKGEKAERIRQRREGLQERILLAQRVLKLLEKEGK